MSQTHQPLTIRLKPGFLLLASILVAHFAAGLALFLMALPFWATGLLMLLVVVSAVRAWRAQVGKRGLSLVLAADGALQVNWRDGTVAWARVLPGAVVFPAVLWFTLVWSTLEGRPLRLRLMLIAAEVEEDPARSDSAQWRRLRTWLRYRALASGPEQLTSPDDA
jgi:hypothetical protein